MIRPESQVSKTIDNMYDLHYATCYLITRRHNDKKENYTNPENAR